VKIVDPAFRQLQITFPELLQNLSIPADEFAAGARLRDTAELENNLMSGLTLLAGSPFSVAGR